MKRFIAIAASLALLALPALASEASFDRTLSLNGRAELSIHTGAGNIHLIRGSDNRVHIFGKVKAGWGGSDEKVRNIAAHPPIEQTGNIVRIGAHTENLRNISIDYEIEAPAGSYLESTTGSGNITIDGVGERTHLSTGSGNIHANGLHGGFLAETGSGDISIEQTEQGDVTARTGSGNIDLRGIRGGLNASTGSGNIRINGTPSAPWTLHTGSGNVELSLSGSGFVLDASTGSGSIHTNREITSQGTQDRHHLHGKFGNGGPTVRAETGSGDIRIQ